MDGLPKIHSGAHMCLRGITHRDQLLYTLQLPSHSSTPSYRATSHTILTLWDSVKWETRFVCRPRASICSKINICHIFLQSSLMKSLQPAASALPGVSRERCCAGRGACQRNIAHRQGLYPSLAWINTPSNGVNENKIVSSKMCSVRLVLKKKRST